MMLLSKIIAFLRGGTPSFLPLENAVFKEVGSALGGDLQRRFFERLKGVNLVQRLDGGREVNFYRMERGKAVLEPSLRVSDIDGEHVLATFILQAADGSPMSGRIWIVDGRLTSMEFDQPTEHILSQEPLSINIGLNI